jgi:hypothetical protein
MLRGLKSCWMPEIGRWSHIFYLDGRVNPNRSVPSSDVFYSLNVMLGLSKIARCGLHPGHQHLVCHGERCNPIESALMRGPVWHCSKGKRHVAGAFIIGWSQYGVHYDDSGPIQSFGPGSLHDRPIETHRAGPACGGPEKDSKQRPAPRRERMVSAHQYCLA